MAGHYFYDPRPFYGHNASSGLMPLDELFYGKYEPVPYWMDQRMAFGDYAYPGQYKQMSRPSPAPMPQLHQMSAYKRPESRDDSSVDMYRRNPYNFHGLSYGGHHQQLQSQDDTWVHAMSNTHGHGPVTRYSTDGNGNDQYRQIEPVPIDGYMPNGSRGMADMPMNYDVNTHTSGKGNNLSSYYNTSTNTGSHANKQQMSANKSTGFGGFGNIGFGNGSNRYNGYDQNVKGGAHSGKSGVSSKHERSSVSQQRYGSSSDDFEGEYEKVGNNNWASNNSSLKQHGSQSGSKGNGSNRYYNGYEKNSGVYSQHLMSTKSGGHNSGGSHQGGKSTSDKALRFQGSDSSSSDSEDGGSYGHSKKKSSSKHGASTKMSNHGNHGSSHGRSLQNHHQGFQQQSKQMMQYGSFQSKGVELKVPICCDNCERKVKDCLEYMDGVESVLCDQWNRKVIVYGNVKPDSVLKRVRRVKKASELWQQAKQQLQLRAY